MNQCPQCGVRRFVSNLLMDEVTGYDEGGEQEFRASTTGQSSNTPAANARRHSGRWPPDRRGYYDHVAVIETERRVPSVINSASWRGGSSGVSQRGSPGGSTTYWDARTR